MNIQVEKLELMQLLLNIDSTDALKKVRAVLKKYAAQSDTDYLLSSKANSQKILQSIDDLDKGKGKAIKTEDLRK